MTVERLDQQLTGCEEEGKEKETAKTYCHRWPSELQRETVLDPLCILSAGDPGKSRNFNKSPSSKKG